MCSIFGIDERGVVLETLIKKYMEGMMVPIPSGIELIRRYRDSQKWLSSDSTLSIPGTRGNMLQSEETVTINRFLIAKYPVTKSLYEAVVNKNGMFDGSIESVPVVNVSWYEAVRFCNLLSSVCGFESCYILAHEGEAVSINERANGFRLPTDAQWQYACKAGAMGYTYGEIGEIAWYKQNSSGQSHVVGRKVPNNWGLYDMIGNVWEWCWDLYDEETYGPYRIFRGGSWAEEVRGCGATSRRRGHPSFGIDDLGFRLVRAI